MSFHSWLVEMSELVHTLVYGFAEVAGNMRHCSLTDSGEKISACCAEEQAVKCHIAESFFDGVAISWVLLPNYQES
jgi:hypothetical protein